MAKDGTRFTTHQAARSDDVQIPSSAETRVLAALVDVYERDGRATVRAVAARANRSISPTHAALSRLRSKGWVSWSSNRDGTLRPLVRTIKVAT